MDGNKQTDLRVGLCSASALLSNTGIDVKDALPKNLVNTDAHLSIAQLTIPDYQRPYCWGVEQLTTLISSIVEHQQNSVTKPLPYYLGSIVLHQDEQNRLNIIDGQQRITSLALFKFIQDSDSFKFTLKYKSLESKQQIKKNIDGLRQSELKDKINSINFETLQFSVVITYSEDEAYHFFETQNTAGVRLSGDQIIKAHHLRAVAQADSARIDPYARRWEFFTQLPETIELLLKGRYWQSINYRDYPTHTEKEAIKKQIVSELATQTGNGGDKAFGQVITTHLPAGQQMLHIQPGYALRQPLNNGVNTIHYLEYFTHLYQRYFCEALVPEWFGGFYAFYQYLVLHPDLKSGCRYLKPLLDSSLLLYISQFGDEHLDIAAKKLFRVLYSRRVENQTTVKEASAVKFIKETPVFDWITTSFTPEQLFAKLDAFELIVNPTGLDTNTVKRRFVVAVFEFLFEIKIVDNEVDGAEFKAKFDICIKELAINTNSIDHNQAIVRGAAHEL